MGEDSRPGIRREVCFTFSTGVGSSSNLQLQHSRAVLPGTCLATCCQKLRWLGCTVKKALCRAALCSVVQPAIGLLALPLVEGCPALPSLSSCGAVLEGPDAALPFALLGRNFCWSFSSFTWDIRRQFLTRLDKAPHVCIVSLKQRHRNDLLSQQHKPQGCTLDREVPTVKQEKIEQTATDARLLTLTGTARALPVSS